MTFKEYPKYLEHDNEKGFVIVEDKEEEQLYKKEVKLIKEEKNEPTSENNSKGTNKKKPNVNGRVG